MQGATPSVSITRSSASDKSSIGDCLSATYNTGAARISRLPLPDFLFRDDKGVSEEGWYCAYLCAQSSASPPECTAAAAQAEFGFIVTSTGCWNYAALIGSTVALCIALLITCIIAFVVWRRRRSRTSSGRRSRLPSISLPSLNRSRSTRFTSLVDEAEIPNVSLLSPPADDVSALL